MTLPPLPATTALACLFVLYGGLASLPNAQQATGSIVFHDPAEAPEAPAASANAQANAPVVIAVQPNSAGIYYSDAYGTVTDATVVSGPGAEATVAIGPSAGILPPTAAEGAILLVIPAGSAAAGEGAFGAAIYGTGAGARSGLGLGPRVRIAPGVVSDIGGCTVIGSVRTGGARVLRCD